MMLYTSLLKKLNLLNSTLKSWPPQNFSTQNLNLGSFDSVYLSDCDALMLMALKHIEKYVQAV